MCFSQWCPSLLHFVRWLLRRRLWQSQLLKADGRDPFAALKPIRRKRPTRTASQSNKSPEAVARQKLLQWRKVLKDQIYDKESELDELRTDLNSHMADFEFVQRRTKDSLPVGIESLELPSPRHQHLVQPTATKEEQSDTFRCLDLVVVKTALLNMPQVRELFIIQHTDIYPSLFAQKPKPKPGPRVHTPKSTSSSSHVNLPVLLPDYKSVIAATSLKRNEEAMKKAKESSQVLIDKLRRERADTVAVLGADAHHEEEFCYCRTPGFATDAFIACEGCGEWYHARCLGLPEDLLPLIDKFICPTCVVEGKGFTLLYKKEEEKVKDIQAAVKQVWKNIRESEKEHEKVLREAEKKEREEMSIIKRLILKNSHWRVVSTSEDSSVIRLTPGMYPGEAKTKKAPTKEKDTARPKTHKQQCKKKYVPRNVIRLTKTGKKPLKYAPRGIIKLREVGNK